MMTMTLECPWCGTKDFDVRGNAFMNADRYSQTNLVVTNCCKNPITITPLRSYRVAKYLGAKTEDDWGNLIKQPEKPPFETYRDASLAKRGQVVQFRNREHKIVSNSFRKVADLHTRIICFNTGLVLKFANREVWTKHGWWAVKSEAF